MSSPDEQLKSSLSIAALSSFYGVASLSVWFLGPLVGLGAAWRIGLIVLLLLTWPLAFLFRRARAARRKKSADAATVATTDATNEPKPVASAAAATTNGKAKGAAPARAYEELARNAEEAVRWLRSTRLSGTRARDAVYALPWFLVAGPPASGKTSLLLASELELQTLPRQKSVDLDSVRPTRHCEWRISDVAVFLDTAGRYQNEGTTQNEWAALGEVLKQHRKSRPLDGLLVVMSTEKLLRLDEGEIEQQARVVRARLDALSDSIRLRLPVYLVFTHTDAIAGFVEFFGATPASDSGGGSRSEVWGTTIPLEKSAHAQALFDAEFDALCESLMRRRLLRLAAPAAPERQLRTFDFPYLFSAARNKFSLFTSTLFRPNPFSESPLLRGFYFTGIVRGGDYDDDETLVVKAANLNGNGAGVNGNGAGASPPLAPGYFTARLIRDVVVADQHLAASFQAERRRPSLRSIAPLSAAAVALLFLFVGVAVSFYWNRALVADAQADGERLNTLVSAGAGREAARPDSAQARSELDAMDALRATLKQIDDAATTPIYRAFGLYSGNELRSSLRPVYFDALEQRFRKPIVAALERDLRAFSAPPAASANKAAPTAATPAQPAPNSLTPAEEEELGRHYDLLKAYLMLGDARRVEPSFLAGELTGYWKKFAPPDREIVAQQQLEFFAAELREPDAPHIKVDDALVAAVRGKLVAYPAVNRFYKRLISETNAQTSTVSLDTVLEGRSRGALTGTYSVPGSYTIEGYRERVAGALAEAAVEIGRDDWVMGARAGAPGGGGADAGKLREMYFRDYADQWRNFLRGLGVREYATKADAVEVLAQISSSDSPLERVLSAVARQTNFSAPPEGSGVWHWIKNLFARRPTADTGATSEPEKEFRPLFAFVAAPEGKKEGAPVAQYRAALAAVVDPLAGASQTQLEQTARTLLTGRDDLGLQKAEQTVAAMLEPFKQTAGGGEAAALLKQPLDNLRALLYGSGYAQIQQTWRGEIYPKSRALEAGFPFVARDSEAPLADLVRFINSENGQFTVFFNTQLAGSFDDVQGAWALKESGAYRFSKDFIKYLNDVRRLREALFPNGGAQPEVLYALEVEPVENTNLTIEIDGQQLVVENQKPAKFFWPARAGTPAGASIKVEANGAEEQTLNMAGDWGLFRLFAAGSPAGRSDNSFALKWTVGDVQVRATLRPLSLKHPFQTDIFSKVRAPRGL